MERQIIIKQQEIMLYILFFIKYISFPASSKYLFTTTYLLNIIKKENNNLLKVNHHAII